MSQQPHATDRPAPDTSGAGAARARHRRLSATAPEALSSWSGRAASTMNGAWSSLRSRSL